ncbi:hypothetical protein GCM10010345_42310 [Streptomyces canarius]|uniref:Transposase n=1 Tax=Streptomyces canarius TaxID=285453 RepID=A0ABQ3CPE8_9ACTN|nr:hypothetical protein GCM10010345_42310 [Streptomyces canarius]
MGATRNLATDPGVIATDGRAPSSRGGGGEKYARRQNARLRHPHAAAVLLIDALWTRTRPMLDPLGFPLPCAGV